MGQMQAAGVPVRAVGAVSHVLVLTESRKGLVDALLASNVEEALQRPTHTPVPGYIGVRIVPTAPVPRRRAVVAYHPSHLVDDTLVRHDAHHQLGTIREADQVRRDT